MKYDEYQESKQHGAPDFPLQLYSLDKIHPQYVMPLHWHKEMEIILVKEGTLHLYLNNLHHCLQQGDIAFVNCKELHRAIPSNCRYQCLVFDLRMMLKRSSQLYASYIEPLLLSDRSIEPLVAPSDELLAESIHSLFSVVEKQQPYYEMSTMSKLFEIFALLYQQDKVRKTVAQTKHISQTRRIAELIRWIEANHAEPLTLRQLANQSGLTTNYLCRIFKEYTGKTPIEYINALRIDHVCHDLRWEQKNITEAALSNGFNDISYFCKVFKKHMGISAGQYLKENAASSVG